MSEGEVVFSILSAVVSFNTNEDSDTEHQLVIVCPVWELDPS